MNRALLDSDLPEARSRARLLQHQANSTGDPPLEEAAALVVRLLGPPGATPSLACGAAMLALSTQLGERLSQGCPADAPSRLIQEPQGQVVGARVGQALPEGRPEETDGAADTSNTAV
jgi:hypothetical protein